MQFADDVPKLPTDPESLINMRMAIAKGGAARILRPLADAYPNGMRKEELGEAANIEHSSGTFGTYLATLKRNGLVKAHGREIKLSRESITTEGNMKLKIQNLKMPQVRP
jgi:hypothetical protein